MVKKPEKGKYLTLEDVRIHYDENKDSIVITSKDPDIPQGKSIYLNLNNGRGAEKVLREMLENAGMIEPENIKDIPSIVNYESSKFHKEWHAFPLGVASNRKEVFWDPNTTGHLMLWGQTGSERSTVERNLIFHCLNNPEYWRVSVIDTRPEFKKVYETYKLERFASNQEDANLVINDAHAEMMARYMEMERLGAGNYLQLDTKLHAHMIFIDDLGILNLENDKDKYRKFKEILTLGRAAGIHVVTSLGMRMALSAFTQDFLSSVHSRLIAGKVEYLLSKWIVGNKSASELSDTEGRIYFQEFGKGMELQGYYSDPDWLEKQN